MSISDKSSTATTNTATNGNTSLVSTPTNPGYVDSTLSTLAGGVNNLAAQDPYSFVAPANSLLTGAGATAAGLHPNDGMYAGSTDLATSVGQSSAPDIASLMRSFQNPWQRQVVDSTLAGFDDNAGTTRAADTLARGADTTFGGSGGAIQTALNEQKIANERSQLQSGLETAGFNTALTGATSQAQAIQAALAQRLAAAGQITSNANSQTAAANQDLNTEGGLGGILQAIQQTQAGAPITTLGSLSSITGALPLNLEHGTNANGTTSGTSSGTTNTTDSDPLGQISKLLAAIGSLSGGGGGAQASGGH